MTWWFFYEWGKPNGKKPNGVIFRSPLPKLHYYHNKSLQVKESQVPYQLTVEPLPTYSWTLTSIPNWTCSVVTVPLSDARLLSTWLTVAWIPVRDFKTPTEKIAGCKVLQFIHMMKIKKMLGYKTLWCKYIATFSRERGELVQEPCLRSQFAWKSLLNACATYVQFYGS